MIVVTAAGGSPSDCATYRRIVEKQAARCAEFGYAHQVYDLGGLGIGEPFAVPASDFAPQVNGDSLPAATFKATLVMRAFSQAKEGEVVCWLDADCIPLQHFNPLAGLSGIDGAVTLRPVPEIGLSNNPALDYLNSGVVWIRHSKYGRTFCRAWETASVLLGTDQGALNEVVAPQVHSPGEWNSMRGHARNGMLVLDCAEWNNWQAPFTGARIAHFKRGIRGQAVNYL
jgi:hypothetical protein